MDFVSLNCDPHSHKALETLPDGSGLRICRLAKVHRPEVFETIIDGLWTVRGAGRMVLIVSLGLWYGVLIVSLGLWYGVLL